MVGPRNEKASPFGSNSVVRETERATPDWVGDEAAGKGQAKGQRPLLPYVGGYSTTQDGESA